MLGHTAYPDRLASEENINLTLVEMQAALVAISATENIVPAKLIPGGRGKGEALGDQGRGQENFKHGPDANCCQTKVVKL